MSRAVPAAVFGLPVYNGEDHLAEALESLLGQTCDDLAVVVVDNCSTDRTGEIALRYAALDTRVAYERNERTVGLVENWRRALVLSTRHHPAARYFAWASDHDVWQPRWLEVLSGELDAHPEAVLAYPLPVRIDDGGAEFPAREHPFDTAGIVDPSGRLRRAIRGMPAGDMIYGLIRRDALERCGPFPLVLLPDRLQLARLAIEGELRQVPRRLWWRRYRAGATFAVDRQRRAFFPDGVPARAYLPWWAAHAHRLTRSLRGRARWKLGAVYAVESARWELERRRARGARRLRWGRRRAAGLVKANLARVGLRTVLRRHAPAVPGTAPVEDDRLLEVPPEGGVPAYDLARVEVGHMLERLRTEPLGIAALLDGSPSAVAELRRHADLVGGAGVDDYRTGGETWKQHAEKLRALRELDRRGLPVHEPPLLGAFGFELEGGLVNRDTLRFYEILVALDRAEVLVETEGDDRVVLEVGGGWGGLARQLKMVSPGLCYVLVDVPERFLFSATYLLTAFPRAKAVFWRPGERGGALRGADFVFVAAEEVGSIPLEHVDLAVSVASFEAMGRAELGAWVDRLGGIGAARVYSLDRDPSGNVREALGRHYWLHRPWVLRWPHDRWIGEGKPFERSDPRDRPVASDTDRYRHLVGHRRRAIGP